MYDLNELLNEVIDKYYNITGYYVPTISWSEEYMLSRFGQYDYHTNHITISRFLDSELISREALISVILHELIHQQEKEHNAKFKRLFAKFPQKYDYNQELEKYFNEVELKELTEPKIYYKSSKAAYCILLTQDYKKYFNTYNQQTYIDLKCELLTYNINTSLHDIFIIWLVENGDVYDLVGWSNEGNVLVKRQDIRSKKYGGDDFSYNIQTRPDYCFVLPPYNNIYSISKLGFPESFIKSRLHIIDTASDEGFKEDIKVISKYSGEFDNIGLLNSTVDCIAPLKETNVNKLISMSIKESQKSYMRSLWIANLAVKIDENYSTLINRADARLFSSLYKPAADDYILAIEMNPLDINPIIGAVKALTLSSDLVKAAYYLKKLKDNRFDFSTDKELKNCRDNIMKQHN